MLIFVAISAILLIIVVFQVVLGLYHSDEVVFSYLEFGLTMGGIALLCSILAIYPFFKKKRTEYLLAWGHEWTDLGRKPPGFIPPPLMDR